MSRRTSIRVGQRLIGWDGQRGYVDTNSRGISVYEEGDSFQVVWLDSDGGAEGAEHYRLADFEEEGIRFGKGVMSWAR